MNKDLIDQVEIKQCANGIIVANEQDNEEEMLVFTDRQKFYKYCDNHMRFESDDHKKVLKVDPKSSLGKKIYPQEETVEEPIQAPCSTVEEAVKAADEPIEKGSWKCRRKKKKRLSSHEVYSDDDVYCNHINEPSADSCARCGHLKLRSRSEEL